MTHRPTTDAKAGDSDLIASIAEGDRRALALLFQRHGAALVDIAREGLDDPRDAEDLIHDLFLDIWACAHLYHQTQTRPDAWILGRLRAMASDRLQREQATQAGTRHNTQGD